MPMNITYTQVGFQWKFSEISDVPLIFVSFKHVLEGIFVGVWMWYCVYGGVCARPPCNWKKKKKIYATPIKISIYQWNTSHFLDYLLVNWYSRKNNHFLTDMQGDILLWARGRLIAFLLLRSLAYSSFSTSSSSSLSPCSLYMVIFSVGMHRTLDLPRTTVNAHVGYDDIAIISNLKFILLFSLINLVRQRHHTKSEIGGFCRSHYLSPYRYVCVHYYYHTI